ncbi:MAG: hypothetical protein M1818_003522 [Claussenomyces sp. TS43310]|nr:MAG: hypothetical protein M1818_003522 [Claussenomyces sp. TS43310]
MPCPAPAEEDATAATSTAMATTNGSASAPATTDDPTPGPRATRFTQLYQQTLSKTLSRVTYEDFAACFPTVAAAAGGAEGSLREMHGVFVRRLGEFAEAEGREIFRERHVVENLNALEELLADARRRKARAIAGQEPPTPAHLLPASTVLAATLQPQLAQQQSQLNAKLQTTQSQNAALFDAIRAQRRELDTLVAGLEDRVRDLDGAVQSLHEGNEDAALADLREDVRDADAEIAGL